MDPDRILRIIFGFVFFAILFYLIGTLDTTGHVPVYHLS